MKMSLLEIVQEILNDMDGDEVNSIDDTIESQQIANVVKSCYNEMISARNWPHLKRLTVLDSAIDLSHPTHLKIPENFHEMMWFRYDKTKATDTKLSYGDVQFKYPDEFLRIVGGRNITNDNVKTVTDPSGIKLFIYNDKAPEFWTSFDDTYIVCDAYDSGVDSTLQSSKTQVYAVIDPVWVHTDSAIPDLPSDAFAALIEEAKSTAFFNQKQSVNQKAEQKIKRQNQWLSRKAWKAHGGVRYPNYGRTGKK